LRPDGYDKRKVYRALEGHDACTLISPGRNARTWKCGNSAWLAPPRAKNLLHNCRIRRIGMVVSVPLSSWDRFNEVQLAQILGSLSNLLLGDIPTKPLGQLLQLAFRGRGLFLPKHEISLGCD
jgi:hypothetical protein